MSMFFFEKKNQKTFTHLGSGCPGRLATNVEQRMDEVSLLLSFQRKKPSYA
jgi:hypothetical protein